MNKFKKIILGFACMGLSGAYAFTATPESCEPYINSSKSSLSVSDTPNIQACLQACPTLYGSGIDANTLHHIAACKRNLSTLSFVSAVSMQNMQSASGNMANNTFSAPAVQTQNTLAPSSAPMPQAAPVTPAPTPAPIENNSNTKSTTQQIKWF